MGNHQTLAQEKIGGGEIRGVGEEGWGFVIYGVDEYEQISKDRNKSFGTNR